MLNAFGTELCGENCRDHLLHSLLRLDLPHVACPLAVPLGVNTHQVLEFSHISYDDHQQVPLLFPFNSLGFW